MFEVGYENAPYVTPSVTYGIEGDHLNWLDILRGLV